MHNAYVCNVWPPLNACLRHHTNYHCYQAFQKEGHLGTGDSSEHALLENLSVQIKEINIWVKENVWVTKVILAAGALAAVWALCCKRFVSAHAVV